MIRIFLILLKKMHRAAQGQVKKATTDADLKSQIRQKNVRLLLFINSRLFLKISTQCLFNETKMKL